MLGNPQMGFLALLLLLIVSPSDSTIPKLNSIDDLKRIPFGQSVPKHSLALLHWFANHIELNNNTAIQLNFDRDQGDYGTHYYGNHDGLLPHGYRYYTLGNLNHLNDGSTVRRLPSYFTVRLNHLMDEDNLNSARILFSSWNQNTLDQVYLTAPCQPGHLRPTAHLPDHPQPPDGAQGVLLGQQTVARAVLDQPALRSECDRTPAKGHNQQVG